jgi:hypothetical protein
MKRRLSFIRPKRLLVASACLLLTVASARQARAQDLPAADSPDPSTNTTRKIDEYGKIGHCDETARLDNFAIELQNEPSSNGYLVVYVGKNDLPSWTEGILKRAASYLVESRGLEPARVKVIDGGYREERTTELWVVPANDPAPQPSNTLDFKLDRTKAYQWDEDSFNVEFIADDTEDAETEGEAVAGDAAAEAISDKAETPEAAEETPEVESAEAAEWDKEVEKYEIKTVARGVIESESEEEDSGTAQAEAAAYSAAETDGGADAVQEPGGPPVVGEVKISLWWNVETLGEELKAAPDARLCLVYYWGLKSATQERVKELVEQALVKTEQQLGVKRERIIVIDGGRSSDPGLELWVVPRGAEPPKPRPGQKRNFGFYSMPAED